MEIWTPSRPGARCTAIRGGAIPRSITRQEQPFEDSISSFAAEKVAIAQAAAALLEDGETVLVDVGTTAAAAARAIAEREELSDVVVFTNGLKTALELESATPRVTVVVLGGTLRPLQHSLVDPLRNAHPRPDLGQDGLARLQRRRSGRGRHEHQLARGRAEAADARRGDAQGRTRGREQARSRRGGTALQRRGHRPGDHRPSADPRWSRRCAIATAKFASSVRSHAFRTRLLRPTCR